MRTKCAAYWVAVLHGACLFPCGRGALSIRRLLVLIKARAPSPSRCSSTKFLRSSTSPRAFRRRHTCLRVPSLARRHSCAAQRSRLAPGPFTEIPISASFRPQAFAASRRFTPHSSLRACFIPLPRPGFSAVQGLLFPRSTSPSSSALSIARLRRVAPMPLLTVARRARFARVAHLAACPTLAPRLRPRAMSLGFEALLHAGPRSPTLVIHRRRSRSPHRVLGGSFESPLRRFAAASLAGHCCSSALLYSAVLSFR
jgi:hypothetical protein